MIIGNNGNKENQNRNFRYENNEYNEYNENQNQNIGNETSENSNLKITIKNEKYKDIQLLVNSNDYAKDIIDKYKSKLQNDKIIDITFKKQDGKYIFPEYTLKDIGIKNRDVITAIIREEKNEDKKEEEEKYFKNKYKEEGQEMNKESIEQLRITLKKKAKEGLVLITIYNPQLGSESYYINKKDKFQMVVNQYSHKNPGKKWFFVYNGLIVDPEKTIEELRISMLKTILVYELDEKEYYNN
jgi:hypothetical protein